MSRCSDHRTSFASRSTGRLGYVGRLEDDGTQYMTFITGAVPDGYLFNLENEDWRKVEELVGVLHLFDAAGNHTPQRGETGRPRHHGLG